MLLVSVEYILEKNKKENKILSYENFIFPVASNLNETGP